MFDRLNFGAAIVLGLVAGCTAFGPQAPRSLPVTPAFDVLDISTPSGKPGQLAVTAIPFEGKAVVCAAIAFEGKPDDSKGWRDAVLRAASVYIMGEVVGNDLAFATVVPGSSNVDGAEAACEVTTTPWKADYTGAKARVAVGEVSL